MHESKKNTKPFHIIGGTPAPNQIKLARMDAPENRIFT